MIGKALRKATRIEQTARVVPIDCRKLRDPGHDSRLRKHLGFHPEIIDGVVQHGTFAKWLGRTMTLLSKAMESAGDGVPGARSQVVVVLYCKAGNHRSVACHTILQHLLQATHTPGWELDLSLHCSKEIWRQRLCNVCNKCDEAHDTRTAALAKSRKVWRMRANDDV